MVGRSERGVRRLPPEVVREVARAYPFPDPAAAEPEGLLAYGGDLAAERLIAAYARGVFPWYEEPPILWFSPDPRVVLLPSHVRINRTLAKNLRRERFTVRFDAAFRAVVEACARAPRPDQTGTWINRDMIDAYCALHALGFAHSVETYEGETLIGGIYGVSLGAAFFGESMFARRGDASKVALVHLCRHLEALGFAFLDCQAPTPHTTRMGAVPWPRDRFLEALDRALEFPTLCGRWSPGDAARFGRPRAAAPPAAGDPTDGGPGPTHE